MEAKGWAGNGFNPKDIGNHDYFAGGRVLGFGRSWEFGTLFGCVSRFTGLTCWNRAGHGWWLGRPTRYRLF